MLSACQKHDDSSQESLRSELGQRLFFDTRISYNNTKSCASCHDPALAFSDGYRRSITASGEMTLRNAPSLINVSYHTVLNWADPSVRSLEEQHRRPLFGQTPVELGMLGNEDKILRHLRENPTYVRLFSASFPDQPDAFRSDNILTAIAEYVKSLQSFSSPYDRYVRGDSSALSERQKAGMALFFSERTRCVSCHPPPMFTLADQSLGVDFLYRNIGLYNVGNTGEYPKEDRGLAMVTGAPRHDGRFKIPSLRNVTLTAPYMHDGSVYNLSDVLLIYEAGGREILTGPATGDGRMHPAKDPLVGGFALAGEERLVLVDFLHALTDTTWRSNPRFRNPFR